MNAEEKKEWMQRPLALSEQDAEIVKIEGSPESLYPLMLVGQLQLLGGRSNTMRA